MNERVNEVLLGKDMFGDTPKLDIKGILKRKFLIPPFSVLSARDYDWQTRKRHWLALGLQSELGRGGRYIKELPKGISGRRPGGSYSIDKNGYEGGDTEAGKGISVFDPVLCELMYSWFCPENGQIIDPFAGGSVRGIVASIMGYKYWGCDLSKLQIEANQKQAKRICPDKIIQWIIGDAKEQLLNAPEADFIFTCPPYGNLEVYSDNPADLSTMDYLHFIETLERIITLACSKLKGNRYACIVVGDFRDRWGFYHNFPSDTIGAFLNAGLKLYNEIILVTVLGSLVLRIDKQFGAGQKVGKTHQNVLVFKKL